MMSRFQGSDEPAVVVDSGARSNPMEESGLEP
jgi:hypothetical protein